MDGTEDARTGVDDVRVVDPFEDTAPQPVVPAGHTHQAHPHHHEGAPGPAVSAAGVHAAAAPAHPHGRHEGRRARVVAVVAAVAAVALVAVGGTAWALSSRGGDAVASPSAEAGSGSATAASPSGSGGGDATGSAAPALLPASQPTLVLGDSLGLIVYPWLADLVPDRPVTYEAEVGRSTAGTAKALEKLATVPPVVLVSSGTNDGTAAELTAGATRILDALGAQRCVVWIDVVRPETVGETQEQLNAALDALVATRSNVRILHWSAMVTDHPEWLAGDGIHPTEEGAQARAQAFADATASCSPLDPSAPQAEKQYLPDSVFWGPASGGPGSGQGSGQGSSAGSSGSTRSSSPSVSPSTSSTRTVSSPAPAPSTSAPPDPTPTPTPEPTPPPTAEPAPADPAPTAS